MPKARIDTSATYIPGLNPISPSILEAAAIREAADLTEVVERLEAEFQVAGARLQKALIQANLPPALRKKLAWIEGQLVESTEHEPRCQDLQRKLGIIHDDPQYRATASLVDLAVKMERLALEIGLGSSDWPQLQQSLDRRVKALSQHYAEVLPVASRDDHGVMEAQVTQRRRDEMFWRLVQELPQKLALRRLDIQLGLLNSERFREAGRETKQRLSRDFQDLKRTICYQETFQAVALEMQAKGYKVAPGGVIMADSYAGQPYKAAQLPLYRCRSRKQAPAITG